MDEERVYITIHNADHTLKDHFLLYEEELDLTIREIIEEREGI